MTRRWEAVSGGGGRAPRGPHLQRHIVDVDELNRGPDLPVGAQRRPEAPPHAGGKGGRVPALERRARGEPPLRLGLEPGHQGLEAKS